MGRGTGEWTVRHRRSAATVAAASCLLLSACGKEQEREPINFLNPVGPMTPVATAPQAPEVTPTPGTPYEANVRKSTNMLVCLGAFVDKLQKKVTVMPVSSYPPDSKAAFPMVVDLRENGGSGIYPASKPYEAQDYSWLDLEGSNLHNTQPKCEQRPVRLAPVVMPHINQPDLALVGPCVNDRELIHLARPAAAETHDVYSRQYDYGTEDELRAIARDLQATSG